MKRVDNSNSMRLIYEKRILPSKSCCFSGNVTTSIILQTDNNYEPFFISSDFLIGSNENVLYMLHMNTCFFKCCSVGSEQF